MIEPIERLAFVPNTSRVRIRWRNGVSRAERIVFLEQLKDQVRNELVAEKMDSYLETPPSA